MSMPWRSQHLKPLADALARVDALTHPADVVLRQFFREQPSLGQRDRALISEAVFAYLRRRRSLLALAQTTRWQRLAIITLVRECKQPIAEVLQLVSNAADRNWGRELPERLAFALTEVENADVPDALWARLGEDYSADERAHLVAAWQQAADFDLRINDMKTDRKAALMALKLDGLEVSPTPYSPLGIRINIRNKGRPTLTRNPWLQDGRLEVQSESSQLAGLLVAPRRNEMVADFCAGAGGKTLLLGMLMRSQGRLYAFDVSDERLHKLKPRLARSGLSNVQPQRIASENDTKIKRLAGKMDRVLCDVPCSGSGTLQRNPDLKWKFSEQALAELNAKQTSILAAAARLVKPGGRLVYATCSVLRAENEAIVEAFLAKNQEFSIEPAGEILKQLQIPLPMDQYLKLRPDQHETDGFFAAVLKR